jgi:hypothetical protein
MNALWKITRKNRGLPVDVLVSLEAEHSLRIYSVVNEKMVTALAPYFASSMQRLEGINDRFSQSVRRCAPIRGRLM